MATRTLFGIVSFTACVFAADLASAVELRLVDDVLTAKTNLSGSTSMATTNYGGAGVGYIRGGTYDHRTWLRFDVGGLPVGTTWQHVSKATLRVYVRKHPQQSGTFVAGDIAVAGATGTWTESSLTHNLAANIGPGPDVYDIQSVTSANLDEFVEFDVTVLVRDWLDETLEPRVDPLNGLILFAPSGTTTCAIDTKENVETSHHPQLIVQLSGPVGPQGMQGPQGAPGPQGPVGKSVLTGSGVPSDTAGVDGDIYLNVQTNTLIGPKSGGVWPTQGVSLVGPAGAQILLGTQNPADTIGRNGDMYINTQTGQFFGPKASGVWPGNPMSLIGPTGFQILTGSFDPTEATGRNGDLYLNTQTNSLFGPKAAGAWPLPGVSLVGPPAAPVTRIAPQGDVDMGIFKGGVAPSP